MGKWHYEYQCNQCPAKITSWDEADKHEEENKIPFNGEDVHWVQLVKVEDNG